MCESFWNKHSNSNKWKRGAIILDRSQDALEWRWSWVQFASSFHIPNPQDGAMKQLRLYRLNIAGSFLLLKPYVKVDTGVSFCAKLLRTETHCVLAISPRHSVPGSKVRSCLEMSRASSALGESTNWSFLPSSALTCSTFPSGFFIRLERSPLL